VESGLSQLQLQASGDAGRTASSTRDSSKHAGQLATGAAAAGGAAAGDDTVSQSRASSQIRVKKFNKLLGGPLVSENQTPAAPNLIIMAVCRASPGQQQQQLHVRK
jgi:hypothetical protein